MLLLSTKPAERVMQSWTIPAVAWFPRGTRLDQQQQQEEGGAAAGERGGRGGGGGGEHFGHLVTFWFGTFVLAIFWSEADVMVSVRHLRFQ